MKKILFVLLGVIVFVPLMIVFSAFHSNEGGGWYDSLWTSKNPLKWVLFIVLAPLFFTLYFFMFFVQEKWEKLAE